MTEYMIEFLFAMYRRTSPITLNRCIAFFVLYTSEESKDVGNKTVIGEFRYKQPHRANLITERCESALKQCCVVSPLVFSARGWLRVE
jgi:hypothetical protein